MHAVQGSYTADDRTPQCLKSVNSISMIKVLRKSSMPILIPGVLCLYSLLSLHGLQLRCMLLSILSLFLSQVHGQQCMQCPTHNVKYMVSNACSVLHIMSQSYGLHVNLIYSALGCLVWLCLAAMSSGYVCPVVQV